MTNDTKRDLTADELEQEAARQLPDREEMSVITPPGGILPPSTVPPPTHGTLPPDTVPPPTQTGGILPPTVDGPAQPQVVSPS